MSSVHDVSALEDAVGSRPLGSMLKTIHHLDEHCLRIIARSVAAAVAVAPPSGPLEMHLIGGHVGFATTEDPTRLHLGTDLTSGSAGLVFFTPGWRETLRVNGSLGPGASLSVDEAFVHCGKAMIRSQFWGEHEATSPATDDSVTTAALTAAHREFLAAARMALIGSCDASGNADVSPKGDHAGFLRVLDDNTIALPNRPGNQRTDTFHNLIERDDVALLVITPGDDRVLDVRGRARLRTDAELLASMAVNGKEPTIALVVDIESASLAHDDALSASDMWNRDEHVPSDQLPKATKVWTDHIKMDQTPGDDAAVIRDIITEEAMDSGIAQDYEQNLY